MTSASELFHNRRSRIGRDTPEVGFGSSLDRNIHHHHNRRHPRHQNHSYDPDGCDPCRRSSHVRHLGHRVPQSEHEPIRLDHATGQSGTFSSISTNTSSSRTNRPRFTSNDRLPGAVLLARERLLERLRGVTLSGNRPSSRTASSHISWDEFAVSDDFRLVDAGDWETETSREWLTGGISFTDSITQTDPVSSSQESKKPPGLTQNALNCLQLEVFTDVGKDDKGLVMTVVQECSICLERFKEGDRLICLPCGHRFHSECLDPWVRACGDCPYCRAGIL